MLIPVTLMPKSLMIKRKFLMSYKHFDVLRPLYTDATAKLLLRGVFRTLSNI